MHNKLTYYKKSTSSITSEAQNIFNIIKHRSHEILIEKEFIQKISYSLHSGIPLRVKLGIDPTTSDIHIGHTIILNKLRELQELGHTIIFLIGDFTSLIGDPSGVNITRPILSNEQITLNAKTYIDQVCLILNKEMTEFRYNSEWLTKLGSSGIIKLASNYTVARMIEREDFMNRYKNGNPIMLHEFLYPLMQGYDSIALKIDLEIGGTDQKFNLLVGRELQKHYKQKQQSILTMPILEGIDGIEKMSKSKNNYISITEKPNNMFGKLMSISDSLMWRYFNLLSFRPTYEINNFIHECNNGRNPRDFKVLLSKEIVSRFHSKFDANSAHEYFNLITNGGIPCDIPVIKIIGAPISIILLLKKTSLVSSSREAIRNIEQGGVKVNGTKISDKLIKITSGKYVLQIGKRRFVKVDLK